jgi:hypothetical protein
MTRPPKARREYRALLDGKPVTVIVKRDPYPIFGRRADRETVSVKLPPAVLARLEAHAARHGLTRHALMRDGIRRYIDRLEAEDWLAEQRAAAGGDGGDGDNGDGAAGERALVTYENLIMPGTGLTATMAAQIAAGTHPLTAVRGGRGFTTRRLAARLKELGLDIDARTIEEIEARQARPAPELLATLAEALGVKVAVLVG